MLGALMFHKILKCNWQLGVLLKTRLVHEILTLWKCIHELVLVDLIIEITYTSLDVDCISYCSTFSCLFVETRPEWLFDLVASQSILCIYDHGFVIFFGMLLFECFFSFFSFFFANVHVMTQQKRPLKCIITFGQVFLFLA